MESSTASHQLRLLRHLGLSSASATVAASSMQGEPPPSDIGCLSSLPLCAIAQVRPRQARHLPVAIATFDREAANLMFSLVSARYGRASMIVTSNKPFSAWGEIFGDEITAVAMIDRLVDHAEILSLKGDSYCLRDKDLGPATPRD
jgi:hypothetical protein